MSDSKSSAARLRRAGATFLKLSTIISKLSTFSGACRCFRRRWITQATFRLSLSTPAEVIGLELQLLTAYIVRKFSQFLPRTYIRIPQHRRPACPHANRVKEF